MVLSAAPASRVARGPQRWCSAVASYSSPLTMLRYPPAHPHDGLAVAPYRAVHSMLSKVMMCTTAQLDLRRTHDACSAQPALGYACIAHVAEKCMQDFDCAACATRNMRCTHAWSYSPRLAALPMP